MALAVGTYECGHSLSNHSTAYSLHIQPTKRICREAGSEEAPTLGRGRQVTFLHIAPVCDVRGRAGFTTSRVFHICWNQINLTQLRTHPLPPSSPPAYKKRDVYRPINQDVSQSEGAGSIIVTVAIKVLIVLVACLSLLLLCLLFFFLNLHFSYSPS
jgi:hypothetical protein